MSALLRPALVRVGGVVLAADQQVRLHELLLALSHVLSDGLEDGSGLRTVRLELLTGEPSHGARDAAFGFVLASRAVDVACVATLDRAAARALVDVIESQLAELRGTGEITPTEHGLLEFTVLSALDELLPEHGGALALSRFVTRGELSDPAFLAAFDALEIRVSVAGRAGIATLWLPRAAPPPAFTFAGLPPRRDAPQPMQGEVEVMLALPQVLLSKDEVRAMRRGDVIVLGSTDLGAFATEAQLVTSNAWRLCDARIERDGTDLVTVRCGPLAIGVFQPRPEHDDQACLLPVTGSVLLSLDRIRAWPHDARIDLKKPAGGAVDLLLGPRWFAAGEMVRVEGELGVRILDLDEAARGQA